MLHQRHGLYWVVQYLVKLAVITADLPFLFLATALELLLGRGSTRGMVATRDMSACTSMTAPPGIKLVTILIAKLLQMKVATVFP